MEKTIALPTKVTPKLIEEMDAIIEEGWYANRSDFIRDALREMIRKMKADRLEAAIKADVAWGLYGKE